MSNVVAMSSAHWTKRGKHTAGSLTTQAALMELHKNPDFPPMFHGHSAEWTKAGEVRDVYWQDSIRGGKHKRPYPKRRAGTYREWITGTTEQQEEGQAA